MFLYNYIKYQSFISGKHDNPFSFQHSTSQHENPSPLPTKRYKGVQVINSKNNFNVFSPDFITIISLHPYYHFPL